LLGVGEEGGDDAPFSFDNVDDVDGDAFFPLLLALLSIGNRWWFDGSMAN
jgi:hypothetical protein